MKCEGSFIFKGIEKRDGGEFTNERGQKIVFKPTYQISLDEIVNGKAEPRTFKFPADNQFLADKFKSLKLYAGVIVNFEIELYKTNIKITPYDVFNEQD